MRDWKNVKVSLCLKCKDMTIIIFTTGSVAKVTLFVTVLWAI